MGEKAKERGLGGGGFAAAPQTPIISPSSPGWRRVLRK